MKNCFLKIYSVNAKALHIYSFASQRDKDLLQALFTRSNRLIEEHTTLVLEDLGATNDSDTRENL
jgi:hypothetical protein